MNRNRFEIVKDILIITKETNLKTPILSGANMSYNQLEKYLDLLINRRLLKSYEFDGKTFYKTTEKGFSFLKIYQDLNPLLNTHASPTVWQNHIQQSIMQR